MKKRTWILSLLIPVTLVTGSVVNAREGATFHEQVQQAWNSMGSGDSDNDSQKICMSCHVPGSSQLDASNGTGSYVPYSSPTMNAEPGSLGAQSLVCLSCHDGAIANGLSPSMRIGKSLSDDHPVGITYDSALALEDGELHDPEITPSGLGGSISEDLLNDGRIDCNSCHSPHAAGNKMLIIENNQSRLCLTCHNK